MPINENIFSLDMFLEGQNPGFLREETEVSEGGLYRTIHKKRGFTAKHIEVFAWLI